MKKLFLILIVCLSLCTTVSCKNQFDRTDTENLYAQIVFSNNKKVNLELYYDKAPKPRKCVHKAHLHNNWQM